MYIYIYVCVCVCGSITRRRRRGRRRKKAEGKGLRGGCQRVLNAVCRRLGGLEIRNHTGIEAVSVGRSIEGDDNEEEGRMRKLSRKGLREGCQRVFVADSVVLRYPIILVLRQSVLGDPRPEIKADSDDSVKRVLFILIDSNHCLTWKTTRAEQCCSTLGAGGIRTTPPRNSISNSRT